MTIGIIDFGTYIPHYRLARAAIGEAWQMEQAKPLLLGERAVAGFDEDSLTMATEAALHALAGQDTAQVDALYFASTTAPFSEKSSAAVIALACDLPANRTADFGNSLRASTTAVAQALDSLKAATIHQALIAAADMRRPEPGTLLEAISGDGAAALLLGSGPEVIAELVGQYHLSDPTIDTWHLRDGRYLQSDDETYTNQVGYLAIIKQAMQGLLQTSGLQATAINGVAAYVPDGRIYMSIAKQSPLSPAFLAMGQKGPAPSLLMQAGNLGTAFPLAQLALLLETAKPGDHLALIGYGDGANAFLFRVTPAITKRPPKRPTAAWLRTKATLPYNLALYFRQNLQEKPLFPPTVDPWTSLPLMQRERDALLRLHAQKCNQCGALWWPHRPNCYDCGNETDFSTIRLSGQATLASFVAEWAMPTPLPPAGLITADTPEGARITNATTDGDPRHLKVGDAVEFALRIFHTAKSLPHYSWKIRQCRI